MNVDTLLLIAQQLEQRYKDHFQTPLPDQLVGWWDPNNIALHPEELAKGVADMKKDIENAIATNTPIEPVPDEIWNKIVF